MLTYSLFTRCLLLFCAVIINMVIFMASQDEVIDSLVSVVRTAVQRNAAPHTTMQTADDADDFSAVLSATRATMNPNGNWIVSAVSAGLTSVTD